MAPEGFGTHSFPLRVLLLVTRWEGGALPPHLAAQSYTSQTLSRPPLACPRFPDKFCSPGLSSAPLWSPFCLSFPFTGKAWPERTWQGSLSLSSNTGFYSSPLPSLSGHRNLDELLYHSVKMKCLWELKGQRDGYELIIIHLPKIYWSQLWQACFPEYKDKG